jgi:hypothetical protein
MAAPGTPHDAGRTRLSPSQYDRLTSTTASVACQRRSHSEALAAQPDLTAARESIQHMTDHAISELWFEPSRFRRHDRAGVGDRHEVAHLRRIDRERDGRLPRSYEPLQFAETSTAADELDALVAPRVENAETGSMTYFASSVTGSRASGSSLWAASAATSGRNERWYQRPPRTTPTSSTRAGRTG